MDDKKTYTVTFEIPVDGLSKEELIRRLKKLFDFDDRQILIAFKREERIEKLNKINESSR